MCEHCWHSLGVESSVMDLKPGLRAIVTVEFKICCFCGERRKKDSARYIRNEERVSPHGPYWRGDDTGAG